MFKHGESLAIVLPDSLARAKGLRDGDEFEWFETDKGVFVLVSKPVLNEQVKQSVIAELVSKSGSQKPSPITPVAAQAQQKSPLGPKGFIVLDTELEAKTLSSRLEKEIKAGEVVGVRGFDKKFYIVSTNFYQSIAPRVEQLLKTRQTLTAPEAAQELGLEEPCAIAVLHVMKEEGELIEKKRGVFAPVR